LYVVGAAGWSATISSARFTTGSRRHRHIHGTGARITFRVGIFGTTIFYQSSTFDGKWYGYIAPFGMPAPGQCKVYYVLAVRKSEGDEASQQALLAFAMTIQRQIVADDAPIARSLHFRPGTLSRSDRASRSSSSPCVNSRGHIPRPTSSAEACPAPVDPCTPGTERGLARSWGIPMTPLMGRMNDVRR